MTSGSSSVGRATAFQAVGRGFEPRLPLRKNKARWLIGESDKYRKNKRERSQLLIDFGIPGALPWVNVLVGTDKKSSLADVAQG